MSKADLRRESERHLKNKLGRKRRRDAKLQELETQLQFAESRCGTLKQQLDYIKQVYGYNKGKNIDAELSKEEGHGDGAVLQLNQNELAKWSRFNGNLPKRENGDGPELEKQSAAPSNTTIPNSSNKVIVHGKHETKKKSPKPKANLKLSKVKKNPKKVKKRRKHDDGVSSKVSNVSSQTGQMGNQIWPDPVIEIYKNSALNVESESGFEVFVRSKLNKPNEVLSEILRQKASTRNHISDQGITKSHNSLAEKRPTNIFKEESMQTDVLLDYDQLLNNFANKNDNINSDNNNNNNKGNDDDDDDENDDDKRTELNEYLNKENTIKSESVYTEPVKSYCQPTISSKRKQIERGITSNLNNLNIRQIPFVAAKSTAPSHNIGVNIQQVLSIIKKRQPLTETLMNANDMVNNENPLASLLSCRKIKTVDAELTSVPTARLTSSAESKKRTEGLRTSLSHWKSNSEITKDKPITANAKPDDENADRTFKIDNLKKVLIFLHEDFTSLSQKYKRLQKKLIKRNISKTEAKDELANIERDLEKKEEEITVVISLYKEVLNLKEEIKTLQEKYNAVTKKKPLMTEGLRQSNSAHFQMTTLLRKIQNFQDKLKG